VTAQGGSAVYSGSDLQNQVVLRYEDNSKFRAMFPAEHLRPIPKQCAVIEAQARQARQP
jgi:hypothetical protein